MTRKLRYLVTGREGQVARSLLERATAHESVEIITASRPEFNLRDSKSIESTLDAVNPDIIISAAAYTSVDKAEKDFIEAKSINTDGVSCLARWAGIRDLPLIHISTDYVFDGRNSQPYKESDDVSPLGVYGQTKLEAEREILKFSKNHVILRTSWVYSPYGANFVKTMLSLSKTRDSINVVNDQYGNPTSAIDLADGILCVANNILERRIDVQRGIFHLSGSGEASWSDFAKNIMQTSRKLGGPSADIREIPSVEYPTAAVRPKNSRLDCGRVSDVHGIRLPNWQDSVYIVVKRILDAGDY